MVISATLLMGIWFLLTGLFGLFGKSHPMVGILMSILALFVGVLLLLPSI